MDSVTVQGLSYLATYTYQAASGASGVFTIRVKGDGASFLNDGQGLAHDFDVGETQLIGVGIDCFEVTDCAPRACQTVACTGNACVYTNLAQGTPCDYGQYCTETDECDGNGTCVGRRAPREMFSPQSCEGPEQCICATGSVTV